MQKQDWSYVLCEVRHGLTIQVSPLKRLVPDLVGTQTYNAGLFSEQSEASQPDSGSDPSSNYIPVLAAFLRLERMRYRTRRLLKRLGPGEFPRPYSTRYFALLMFGVCPRMICKGPEEIRNRKLCHVGHRISRPYFSLRVPVSSASRFIQSLRDK